MEVTTMDNKKRNGDKIIFGLVPLAILMFSPVTCWIMGQWMGIFAVIVGTVLLTIGVLGGKVGLFG